MDMSDTDKSRDQLRHGAKSVMEQMGSEEALRASQRRIESILRAAPTGIGVVIERIITEVNQRLCNMTGYEREELIGKSARMLYPSDDDFNFVGSEKYQQMVGHGVGSVETRWQLKDGKILDILLSSAPIEPPDLSKGVTFTAMDITERKAAEQALRRYETLSAHSRDIILLIERDGGKILEANLAAERAYGYSREELLGLTIMDLRAHGTISPLIAQMEEADAKGVLFETVHLRGDGSTFPVEVSAQGATIDGTRTLISIIRDITDRKEIEEQLRQSEEMYRTLVAASPDALIVTDLSGRIILASQKTVELWGFPSEQQALGRNVVDLVAPGQQHEVNRVMRQLLTAEKTRTRELVLKRDDGTLFDGEIHAAPIKSSDGAAKGAVIIVRDITERNTLQAQILQSQKMEAIGTLAGGVAHDFNNILMALMGYTSLVGMGLPGDHAVKPYVDQILRCTSKAAHLTQSLLAFSRKQTIEVKPLNLNSILTDLEKLLRRIVPEDIELIMSLNEDATIMADMTQIDQVIINLVSNAKDAMPNGGKLLIGSNKVDLGDDFRQTNGFGEPGRYALISVIDTGSGMDTATQKKIFEPFFTTKGVGKGTGLGLSTAYGIVKQHQGFITVSSEPGKGSTFSVYLPSVKAGTSDARPLAAEIPGGTETVLLAEDNPDVRKVVGDILTAWGYSIVEAVDGDDAVSKYREQEDKIDLLILDVVMPGKNGREIWEEIRKIKPFIPVIFMSGHTGDVVLERGIEDTAAEYVSKPIAADELLRKVREVLEK